MILTSSQTQGAIESGASTVATEMALVHNVMIRGLNSMLAQAPFVSPTDINDFMEYCISFCVFDREHHEAEEILVFPVLETLTNTPGIMEKNVVQHEEFLPKIHDFQVYVKQVRLGVAVYDAKKIIGLIERFADLFTAHLTAECETLAVLEKYNLDWAPLLARLSKYAVDNADKVRQETCLPGKIC
jgi:hemerythrin-like domain-containing protein